MTIFDEEVKREASQAFAAAARNRVRDLGTTSFGLVMRAAVEEHRRIEEEEDRRPTVRDAVLFVIRAARKIEGAK